MKSQNLNFLKKPMLIKLKHPKHDTTTDKIEIINKVIHQTNTTNGGISYGKSIE